MTSKSSKAVPFGHLNEAEIREALQEMENSSFFTTGSSYSANSSLYADNQMPFAEKHVAYLKSHPKLNPEHYLANLRLMIKVRQK